MKIKPKTWTDEIVKAVAESGGITRLQGAETARVVLLAPVPTAVELQNNYCWCNPDACAFFDLMQATTSLTADDLLIIPTTFDGKKPTKANTLLPTAVLQAVIARHIQIVICIGSDAFKVFFGHGKKPSMNALAGSVLYIPESQFKPVFTFPDPFGLSLSLTGTESFRDRRIKEDYHRRKQASYESLLVNFNSLVQTNLV